MSIPPSHDRAVERFFDAASVEWSEYYGRGAQTLSGLDLVARRAVAERMVTGACAGRAAVALLDAGCGTGDGTSGLAPRRFTVVATDVSTAMVAKAVHGHGLRGCASDVAALPFRAGSFDVVLSLGVLEYVGPHERALREFRRVLRPEGTLVLSIRNRASWCRRLHGAERRLTRPIRALRARLRGMRDEDAGLVQVVPGHSWTPADARHLLGVGGFSLVESAVVTYGWLWPMATTWRANLAFCRWMNAHCDAAGPVAERLGCTAVLRARAV